jgi:hypothetical protein
MKATITRCGLSALAAALVFLIASCDAASPTSPDTASSVIAQGQAGASNAARPFHGTTVGGVVSQSMAPAGRCPPQLPLLFEYKGEGNATHMGRMTIEGSECAFFDPTNPASMASGNSIFVITAANGDWIKVGYASTVISFEPPPSPWLLWSAPMVFIEGTGRFADAQLRNVTWKGGAHLLTLETYSTFDGEIIY